MGEMTNALIQKLTIETIQITAIKDVINLNNKFSLLEVFYSLFLSPCVVKGL